MQRVSHGAMQFIDGEGFKLNLPKITLVVAWELVAASFFGQQRRDRL